jgi:quercetin dioxygenase-like cupin family protein
MTNMQSKKNQSRRRRPARAPRGAAEELPAGLAWLAWAAPAAPAPAPKIKRALLARIEQEEAAAAAPRGWRFDSVATLRGWLVMPFPGVRMKELSVDPARNSALVLVEFAPGTRFPDHEHDYTDEGLILSGDVKSGGRYLHAGDYYYAGPGSKHAGIVTTCGCTALVHLTATVWTDLRARGQPVA